VTYASLNIFFTIFSCIFPKIPYIFFMNYRFLLWIKFILLLFALGIASFLAFFDTTNSIDVDQHIVFVLDTSSTMATKDILSGVTYISRLSAAKKLISTTIFSEPHFSYGLVILNTHLEYIIPPTFDTGIFLAYLSGITTNLSTLWPNDFAQLRWLPDDIRTSYIVVSDFASMDQHSISLPQYMSSLPIRHESSLVLSPNISLSQRIFLYILLWVLVFLVILFF